MKEDREIIPLRTILQNCLNHIENLETNRAICDNYEKEFQDLKHFSETLKTRKEFACTEGEKEVNRKKNRYKDILPFNVTRVILSEYAGIPGSDYINANYIKGASGSPAYIASQGPLPNTVNDFWRMVVECEVQVIVMACNAEEAGKHKCENYWVEKEGEEKRFGMVEICLVKASTVCPDFLVRTMRLKYTNDKAVTEERTICQFHYSAWPDHGVPPLVRPLLDMVRLVRDTQASETLPVLVHCSAGCGRTGTICAIDFVWGLLRAGKLTEEFSLFNLVRDMRKQRVAMVQTKEQYILVHQAVRELFKEQLRVIESHPYENIDVNGVPLIKDFEEPLYDTIAPCKDECNEKQDKSEMEKKESEKKDVTLSVPPKLDAAPPLPRKKRPNVPCSKQEKEVENLTEKNRCAVMEKEKETIDVSPSNSLLSKPRIAKLKALFERSPTSREKNSKHQRSQTVSRSHSLGAVRKPIFSEATENPGDKSKQPIPDGGKLKVPKLSLSTSTVISRPVPLIKRSKSLKIVSQPPTLRHIPPEIQKQVPRPRKVEEETSRRRRSLESLMGDDHPVITWPAAVTQPGKGIHSGFQNLAIDPQRKFVPGLGVRERRNSFRQAISREEPKYERIWADAKPVRNQNGKIAPIASEMDKREGNAYERFELRRNMPPNPKRDEQKRPPDTKNLFLQRLNNEIQEEKNKQQSYRPRYAPPTESNPNFLGIHSYEHSRHKEFWIPPRGDYATSYDLHAKKFRKPQTDPRSLYSSSELSHSDQNSSKSDSPRSERIVQKEVHKVVPDRRLWTRQEHGSESSSSSSVQELSSVINSKPPDHAYNYGIVARVKLRPPRTNQTRDDFVLNEPVAPPRVKRHASVMVSRHSMIDATTPQLTAWTSPANKFMEGWNGSIGVDLDAVAASIQRQKTESSSNETSHVNKNYTTSTSPPQQPFKKQQHYL